MNLAKWLGASIVCSALTACSIADLLAERAAITRVNFAYDKAELVGADIPFLTPEAKAQLKVTLAVDNPNPIAATLDRLSYDVFIEGTKVGTGSMNEAFSVPAKEKKPLVLPINVPYAALPQAALQAIQNRRILLTLKGTSHIVTPLGPLEFPLEISQTLSL